MQPIVNGIKKEFKACLQLERVNFHAETQWHILLSPMGTPEFALLDSSRNIIYASGEKDFSAAAGKVAKEMQQEMARFLQKV